MSKHKTESGHWYDKEGEPRYTIVGVNGKERNTTLRDAKKEGYVPSVTSILNIIAKPSLENWKITQALEASLKVDQNDLEYINKCKYAGREVGMKAAKQGTKIHALIEKGFLGKSKNKTYKVIKNFLDNKFPNEEWIAEDSFCSDLGYGGKIDLYSKSGIFVDFKTKDNLEGKDPDRLVYDEHGMQLSAYAQGCKFKNPIRVSIFVDRANTELIACHVWNKETHEKHKEMFNSILKYWQLVKNYEWKKIKTN